MTAAANTFRLPPGFEHIAAYWEPRWQRPAVKIKPGEYFVTSEDWVITTVLGSCISACIHDPYTGFGGINHFMLPEGGDEPFNRSSQYGMFAMEQLINELMKRGSQRRHLQVKLTGGGNMLGGLNTVGQQNIDFIQRYIRDEGLTVLACDFAGDQARRVAFFPASGRLLVKKLDHRADQKLIAEERSYQTGVGQQLENTDVELF